MRVSNTNIFLPGLTYHFRKCNLNCRSEGPPGPIWCSECGHDPKCCNCDPSELECVVDCKVCKLPKEIRDRDYR